MKYIDYLFYSYYCYYERRNRRFPKLFGGDSRFFALYLLALTFGGVLGLCYILINEYIPLPAIPKLGPSAESLIGVIICVVLLGPFDAYSIYARTNWESVFTPSGKIIGSPQYLFSQTKYLAISGGPTYPTIQMH